MAAAAAPLWLWLGIISCLPHKEERFLYVVYPLVRPAAQVVLTSVVPSVAVWRQRIVSDLLELLGSDTGGAFRTWLMRHCQNREMLHTV